MLADRDEHLHRPPAGAPERWQENLFFICWDDAAATGVLCHVQRVPGAGVQEARVVVVIDGEPASATVESAYEHDGLVPGVEADPVVPFRRWGFRIDVAGTAGRGPLGLLATRSGGPVRVGVDLTLDSVLPVVDFAEGLATVVAGMRADADGPQMGDQQHYEQGGTWSGRLRIGSRSVDAHGSFVRDHSWGVRQEHQGFRAFWTASCLDEGRIFCNAIGVPTGGRVLGIGAVADERGITFTDEVHASFRPAPGIASYDTTVVTFGPPIDRSLTGRTEVHLPILLPHSGPDRYDNNAISRVALGDAAGFGVLEWAAVLDPADAAALRAEEVLT